MIGTYILFELQYHFGVPVSQAGPQQNKYSVKSLADVAHPRRTFLFVLIESHQMLIPQH